MGTTQSDAASHSLSVLFPAIDNETIKNTLETANGDAAKAIVLLIQTPDGDITAAAPPKMQMLPSTEEWKERQTDTKHKTAFIRQQFHGTLDVFWRYLSIIFWVIVSIFFMLVIIFISNGHLVHSSFAVATCACSAIEFLFTVMIIYGVITYQMWCIWVSLLWSGLHGITAIYSSVAYAHNNTWIMYYISSIVVFWCLVFALNVMYFSKLSDAESKFNAMIHETEDVLQGIHIDKEEMKYVQVKLDEKRTETTTPSSMDIKYQFNELILSASNDTNESNQTLNEYSQSNEDPSIIQTSVKL